MINKIYVNKKEFIVKYIFDWTTQPPAEFFLLLDNHEFFSNESLDTELYFNVINKDEATKRKLDKNIIFGKGFTYTNILDNYDKIDRDNIESKITPKTKAIIGISSQERKKYQTLFISVRFKYKINKIEDKRINTEVRKTKLR